VPGVLAPVDAPAPESEPPTVAPAEVPSEVVTPAEVLDPEVEVEFEAPADDPSGALVPADVPDPVLDAEVDAPTDAPPTLTPAVTPAAATPVSPPPRPPPLPAPPVPASTPEVPGSVPVATVGPDPPSVPGPPGLAVGSPVLGSRDEEDPALPAVEEPWGRVSVAGPRVLTDIGLFGASTPREPGPAGTCEDESPGRIAARPRSMTLGRGNPMPLNASRGIGTRTTRPIRNQLRTRTPRRLARTETVLPLPKSRPDMEVPP